MPVRQTSISAYIEMMEDSFKVTESYKDILTLLAKCSGVTDYEMAQMLGYSDPNKIRPRRYELYKNGFVKMVGKKEDKYTHKRSNMWDLTDKGQVKVSEIRLT